ncbi:MAG: glycosyltransferase family 4 protein [Anaerolineae bacterium]
MRIGLITGEYPPMQGGVADFTRQLALAFVNADHVVAVLTDRRGTGLDDAGIEVDPLVFNWNRASLGVVRRWARKRRLDVLNLQYQTAAYNMAPLIHWLPELVLPLPFVTTFHDLRVPYLFPKAGPVRKWWVWKLARGSAAAIVTNPEDEHELITAGGVQNLARIPIGSNVLPALPDGYSPGAWRAAHGLAPDDFLIAYFGFMNRSKGVDVLLRAVAELEDRPVKLVMIGGRTGISDPTNAAFAEEIDALVVRLGLAERVIWTGFLAPEAVSAWLAAADCCALPFLDGMSYRRGSLMAALVHGCAIVSTQPTAPYSEVENGRHMLLVPPGDAAALRDALAQLMQDRQLIARLKDGARDLRRQFDWGAIAAETLRVYGAVLNRL